MPDTRLQIELDRQQLTLFEDGQPMACYPVSTALNGPGEQSGSGCTPRGRHVIRLKVGEGAAVNSVFVGRRLSGEIYSPELASSHPQRDWILTRILWLSGKESGFNRGGSCDTLRRFIYIHGCPESEPMGVARSHGCIRMRNADLLALFDRISVGTPVEIGESFDHHTRGKGCY